METIEDRKKRMTAAQGKTATKEDAPIIAKTVDFSKFELNNWIKESAAKNDALEKIHDLGGAVWIDPEGSIYFRRKAGMRISKLEKSKAMLVLSNFLDQHSILLFTGKGSGDNVVEPDIANNDLHMVEEKFTPFVPSEFYIENGAWYRTSFVPTSFMVTEPGSYAEPTEIKKFIMHLCNNNEEYFEWTINWLAGFIQTLRKSQVALVMKGEQGTGKGIFFNDIIIPMFGEDFTVTVDDDRLKSGFKNWIGAMLFFNLNEIAHDGKTRKTVKNFIKQLVTDSSIQAEQKFVDASAQAVFGNVLITSNETAPLEVEPSDRRFTIFQTGKSLKKIGWNTRKLLDSIESTLPDFAMMLRSHKVDWNLYDKALDTPEKSAIVNATNNRFDVFLDAIKSKSLGHFQMLADEDDTIAVDLAEAVFARGRITLKEITALYIATHEEEIGKRALKAELSKRDPLFFDKKNVVANSGNVEKYGL